MTAVREPSAVARGREKPRLGPPVPARSDWKAFTEVARVIGIDLFPWQEQCARYLTGKGPGAHWLYREVAIIVARQNGKTTLLVPLIVQRLLAGQKIMHTAQNAKLPREVHDLVAVALQEHYPERLPKRRAISYAVGHEEIRLIDGGHYRIVAPTKGGARGPSNDTVIVDELREMDAFDFIAASKPTLTASSTPQMVYLSNAGSDTSEVLNALRARAGYPIKALSDAVVETDPNLAYLEWSASPGRAPDDFGGWLESNPSIGHIPDITRTLEDDYRADRLSGKLAIFETEHLCRWVETMREPFLSVDQWTACATERLGPQRRVYMGTALDPAGSRASAALAWKASDGAIVLRMLGEYTGSPIDGDALGKALSDHATSSRVVSTGYDPLTDRQPAKFLRASEPITGQVFANASAQFVRLVEGGRLRWHDADAVTDDLAWTTRKPHDESGSFQAVRAVDDHPITALLAAIRAVWLASNPPTTEARIW